jgi:hypothetical protein
MRSTKDERKRPQNLLREFDPVRLVRGPRRRNAEVVTAALLGAAVGAGLVYLLAQRSGGGRGGRSLGPMLRSLRRNVAEYAGSAREAIDEAVDSELKDLRRSIRRQRKRFGV